MIRHGRPRPVRFRACLYKITRNMYYLNKKKKSERKPRKKKEKPLPLFDKAGVTVKKNTDLVSKLDKVFSRYIRLRDSKAYGFKYFKCPTCGRILPFEQADCSHYFSRRSNATRFDEDNCMAECRFDNRFNAEHLHKLREALVQRIGEKRFQILEWKHNQTKKWSDFELKEMIKYYQALVEKMLEEK